jgi:hypothetical protein
MREIGDYLGIRSTNAVNDLLAALKRKGLLRSGGYAKARTLIITPDGSAVLGAPPQARPADKTGPRVVEVDEGIHCGRCGAHTFLPDRPCFVCRLLKAETLKAAV